MSDADQKTASEALQAPLRRLEEAGLPRPPSLTLEQYLERLVSAGALSPGAVRRYLTIYQDVRYGSREAPPEQVEWACEALLGELARLVDLDDDALQGIRAKIAPTRAVGPAIASRSTGPRIPINPPPPPLDDGGPGAPAPSLPGRQPEPPGRRSLRQRLPSARSLTLVATALLVWSVAMLGVGYWQSPRIKALVKRVSGSKKKPATVKATPRQLLDHLRKGVEAKPDDLNSWRKYASYAFHIEQYADAIIGYHHIITRKPRDHESLNNLAWLYCTARDPGARDRVQALALAERAYAIDKAPHIADTLAEACWQNGRYRRAVALEEDALRRSSRRKEFFRKQLEKFRKELSRLSSKRSR